jgi:hypothetical protein
MLTLLEKPSPGNEKLSPVLLFHLDSSPSLLTATGRSIKLNRSLWRGSRMGLSDRLWTCDGKGKRLH